MNAQPTRRTMLAGLAGAATAALPAGPASAAESNSMRENRDGPRIGILLYDGFSLLDPTGPAEVLSRVPGARVSMIGTQRGPVHTDTRQAALLAERSIREVSRLDVLLVPGAGERGITAAMSDPDLLDWIRRIDRHSTWTTSVCTGSLLLGAAGLLRSRATTYWASASYLEQTFGVRYVPRRYVRDGKVITAAGVSAGIDMALYLAARLAGDRVARGIQLGVEYDPQPPFDAGNAAAATPELKELARRLIADSQR